VGPQFETCFTLVAQTFEAASRILGYLCASVVKCTSRSTEDVYLYLLCFVFVCTVFCVVCTVFCIVCTVFFVLFRLCTFILICFVSTSVRTTATE